MAIKISGSTVIDDSSNGLLDTIRLAPTGNPASTTNRLYDSAGSLMYAGTAVGGGGDPWTYVSATRPTTDVATIEETGLSGYSEIEIHFLLEFTSNNADIDIFARASAGTWRLLGKVCQTSSDKGGNYYVISSFIRIQNFDASHVADFRIMQAISGKGTASIDNTSNTKELTIDTNTNGHGGYASYAETFDEIKLDPSNGNIEGSTATRRGLFLLRAR